MYADHAEKARKLRRLARADEQGQAGEDNGAAEGRAGLWRGLRRRIRAFSSATWSIGVLAAMAYMFKKNLAATMARWTQGPQFAGESRNHGGGRGWTIGARLFARRLALARDEAAIENDVTWFVPLEVTVAH